MSDNLRYGGLLAWVILGMVTGFVIHSIMSMFSMNPLFSAIITGAASSFFSVLMYIEHDAGGNRFLMGLSMMGLAFLAALAKNLVYEQPISFTVGYLLMGIVVGILISVSVVAYILKE